MFSYSRFMISSFTRSRRRSKLAFLAIIFIATECQLKINLLISKVLKLAGTFYGSFVLKHLIQMGQHHQFHTHMRLPSCKMAYCHQYSALMPTHKARDPSNSAFIALRVNLSQVSLSFCDVESIQETNRKKSSGSCIHTGSSADLWTFFAKSYIIWAGKSLI